LGLRFVSYLYTTKDVPDRWSLVLFLPYCNLRCRHCHNWRLVLGREPARLTEEEVLKEVSNNPLLECLVLSGGEPTVYPPSLLLSFIKKVKKLNPSILVRVDTNGTNPKAVKALKELVDGFAVDVKAPPDEPELYRYATLKPFNRKALEETLTLADGMPLTLFRTTRYPWLTDEKLKKIERFLKPFSSPWLVNEFVSVPDCPFV